MASQKTDPTAANGLRIGWAQADITPTQPVTIAGQFHARVSEGVADPITATVLALDAGQDHAVLVSCDLVGVADALRDGVRARVGKEAADLDPMKVLLNATHTHTAPETRLPYPEAAHTSQATGVDLPVMPVPEYVDFAVDRIAQAVLDAWRTRAPGAVSYGMGCAVVGRNRRWVDTAGQAHMYGNTDTPEFSHIEGYEDHSVNLIATLDPAREVTGIVLNAPSPSQVTESEYVLSADYWHETRQELRRRLGESLFVLPQCSAAGDQSPHLLFDKRAAARMLELSGRTERQEIAHRLAEAVEDTLACIRGAAHSTATLRHVVEVLDVPMNRLTEDDARTATQEADKLRAEYEQEVRKLEAQPELKDEPRWYRAVTRAFRRARWYEGVAERFERQQEQPNRAVEFHVIRLGDIVLATNPFEYYLDFGIYIKARSPAVQTFLVQLAGAGSYVPSPRSTAGGGYGSIPASNSVGPEGGRRLADRTIEIIQELWPES